MFLCFGCFHLVLMVSLCVTGVWVLRLVRVWSVLWVDVVCPVSGLGVPLRRRVYLLSWYRLGAVLYTLCTVCLKCLGLRVTVLKS